MSVLGRFGRLVVLVAIAAGSLVVGTGSAPAGVVKPFTPSFTKVVYGDFVYAGNGALRCPVTGDGAPTTGSGNTPAACANTAARRENRVNDNFFMQWADVDSDPATFNSSRAAVTIPPGAKVEFARLNWAGNTGLYNSRPGVPSSIRMCQSRNFNTPAVLPPGSPANQQVRLDVGGRTTDIAPASYTEDPSSTFSGGQYYSAYADVTTAFAGAPTGSAVDVTVGNVWAPKGFGCMGGWSVAVVYSYPQRNPEYAPSKREVFVYDGHVRQNSSDPTTTTTISGFRAAAADARVGVTAYEGDWGIAGDRFLINGAATPEPATGNANNYFVSNADGVTAPAVANNFSVDAKSFRTSAIPAGATSARLGFATSGDSYLAQNLAFSTSVPELQITKTASPPVVHEGDEVTFTITVTNPSGAPARGVRVTDQAYPGCAREIGLLAGGASHSYTCTATAGPDDVTNTATATGTSALDDPLEGTATATADVIHPAIGITKTADKPAYRTGDTVTFTITVTNTGDTPLDQVTVADERAPGCARALGALDPAGQRTFTCQATAPLTGDLNSATVTGTDQLGKAVTAADEAPVPLIDPAIEVTKAADPQVIRAGEPVTWTITVTNTGDSALDPVTVTDDVTAACGRTLDGPLEAGATRQYTCTANPGRTTTNTVTADGTDRSGQHVTGTAQATVTVIDPSLTIQKDAEPGTVREGDQVTFTITVTNSGDTPLTEVAVADERAPGCARTLGTLPAGAVERYECTLTAPAEGFVNTATATGTDPANRPVTVSDDAVVEVIHPAVSITKEASPEQVREGDTVTFTVTVTNTGDVPLAPVSVADEVAPECARSFGELAPGAEERYECTLVAPAEGFTNTATVTGTPPVGPPVGDSDDATVTVEHPGVTVTKEASPEQVREGDTVTFAITVTNTGDVPLTDVSVADAVAPECARTFAELAAGAEQRYECTLVAPAEGFTNTATVTGTPPVGPPVEDSDDAEVVVIHPGIAVTKDATPTQAREGDPITFTVTVTNTGDVPLGPVSVADEVAPECARTFAELAAGAEQRYECTMVAPGDDVTNTAVATGQDPTGREVTDSADAAVDVIHPAVSITKTADPTQVREGDAVTFTIVVTNTGDVPLTEVAVTDDRTEGCARTLTEPLAPGGSERIECTTTAAAEGVTNTASVTGDDPTGRPVTASDDASFTVQQPGLGIVKDVNGGPFRAGDQVTFTITVTNTGDVPLTGVTVADEVAPDCARAVGALEPGAVLTYECTMIAPEDDVTNTATVTGTPPVGPPVDGTADADVDVIHPGIAISKDAAPAQVRPGDTVTFTITVTNTGDTTLTGVTVADDRTADCNRILAEPLEPGGTVRYECTTVAERDFTNTATARGDDPTGRAVTDTGEAEVDVIGPGITVTKTGPAKPLLPGQAATFTVVVTNTGDVPLTEVTLADPVAPGCAVTIGALAPGASAEPVTCQLLMGNEDRTNTVTASGNDPTGRPVTDLDSAVATVGEPGIEVTKEAKPSVAKPGDTVTFTITVTNTGTVDLTEVRVTDPTVPACDRTFDVLPAGERRGWSCTATAPAAGTLSNTATATGEPDTELPGEPVTGSDTARVSVEVPDQPGVPEPPDGSDRQGPGPDRGPLADTGADPVPTSLLGTGLLVAGLALVLLARKRRRGRA